MIDSSFLTGLAAPKQGGRKRSRMEHIGGGRGSNSKLRRCWNSWAFVKAAMDERGRLLGEVEGVNVWRVQTDEGGVYISEKGMYFKATGSREHADVLAGDIAAGRNLFRVNVKPTWETE